jgi:fibronectin-binding autotransporter adhesin
MSIKNVRLGRLTSVFLFAIAVTATQFAGVQFAHATGGTDTWTGTAGDNKFSTAGNWSGNAAPVNGDVLNFNTASLSANLVANNDISNLSVGGITASGNQNSNYYSVTLGGNDLTLTGNITNSATSTNGTYAQALNFTNNVLLGADTVISGPVVIGAQPYESGTIGLNTQGHNLTLSGSLSACSFINKLIGNGAVTVATGASAYTSIGSSIYSGSFALTSGNVNADSGSFGTGAVTVSGSGILQLLLNSANASWPNSFTLGGSGAIATYVGAPSCAGGGGTAGTFTATLAGTVNLTSNFSYVNDSSTNLVVAGAYTSNNHSFTVSSGNGTLTLPSGTVTAPDITTSYTDSQTTQDIRVAAHETATLDGVRKNVIVDTGGTLEGNGSAVNISVNPGATIAPGHSPGKLTATSSLSLSGTYQAQLKDSTDGDYDQIVVGSSADTTGNDVQILDGAVLDTSLYTGWSIKQGDQFMIIKNLQPSTQKVLGTFSGLPEGKQFTVSGITFSISYVGGDGNDVVLTALTTGKAPAAPNTAAADLKLASPFIIVGLGIATAGILFSLARRKFNQ